MLRKKNGLVFSLHLLMATAITQPALAASLGGFSFPGGIVMGGNPDGSMPWNPSHNSWNFGNEVLGTLRKASPLNELLDVSFFSRQNQKAQMKCFEEKPKEEISDADKRRMQTSEAAADATTVTEEDTTQTTKPNGETVTTWKKKTTIWKTDSSGKVIQIGLVNVNNSNSNNGSGNNTNSNNGDGNGSLRGNRDAFNPKVDTNAGGVKTNVSPTVNVGTDKQPEVKPKEEVKGNPTPTPEVKPEQPENEPETTDDDTPKGGGNQPEAIDMAQADPDNPKGKGGMLPDVPVVTPDRAPVDPDNTSGGDGLFPELPEEVTQVIPDPAPFNVDGSSDDNELFPVVTQVTPDPAPSIYMDGPMVNTFGGFPEVAGLGTSMSLDMGQLQQGTPCVADLLEKDKSPLETLREGMKLQDHQDTHPGDLIKASLQRFQDLGKLNDWTTMGLKDMPEQAFRFKFKTDGALTVD